MTTAGPKPEFAHQRRDCAHVATLLEEASRRRPDAVALREGDVDWTYAELLRAAREAMDLFATQGVVAADRVVIIAENGLAQVAAFFGASLLGAWPTLLNARASAREIDAIRMHAEPRIVAYTVGNSPDAALHAARHGADVVVDLAKASGARLVIGPTDRGVNAEASVAADVVAALIYTSGTTGAPKGVMVTHAGLMSFAERSVAVRRLSDRDVVLGALPMSHIFGVATILLTTIRAAGCVWLQPRFEVGATVAALRRGKLSVLHGVPALYRRLLMEIESQGLQGPFGGLRYAYAGGGALDPALKRDVERALALPLHHGYGMTEYAGSMFVTHVDRPRTDISPGELAPDCEARFAGPDGGDAPVGEPGEIWVRGPGTMFGYYRDPELTRETVTGDGWLRTGDVGHLLPDGALRIVSRARDIIKRSGFTVYPLEVEQQLAEHPAVRLAGVVGVPGEAGEEEIIAFVETAGTVEPAELIEFARSRLSAYKCPQHVVCVDELPLTANGKIRKQTLRDLWSARQ
jgi:long-chain acyl-CoA synthetase